MRDWISIWMNYESFEGKSWDQDANCGYYETFEYDEVEYDIERSQEMN